jgi:uncharacterized protein YndB with AHSA1/START domain
VSVAKSVLIDHSVGGPRLVLNRCGEFVRAFPPIQIEALIKAPVARIFNAWTISEYVEAWYSDPSSVIARCEIDLKSGGRYRLEINGLDGSDLVWGVFRCVHAPHKLTYSLRSNQLSASTLVIVSLLAVDDATRLCLRQDGFHQPREITRSTSEWTSRMERLAHLVA